MLKEITDGWLRVLERPPAGRLEVLDTRETGLALRVPHKGAMTWSVRARTGDGKRTRIKIGSYPELSLAQARKHAKAMVGDIVRGADPIASRQVARAEREARAAQPTVATRLEEWQAARASSWSDRYQVETARLCAREIVPAIGSRPLVETTRQDWTKLIADTRKRAPALGSALYRLASSFLGHAEAAGWIDIPLLPRKGLAAIAPPVPARERVLTDDELASIWHSATALKPKPRLFVRLLIVTACRELEAADIATGEIDFEAENWSLNGSRTKNGQSITLPLPPALLADLRSVWPAHGTAAGSTWRLLGAVRGGGFRGFSKLKTWLDTESGVKGWRYHDLRRTARTGMTRLGVPRDHAEAALNHVSGRSALERTYDRHDYAPEVIAALKVWQDHVASLIDVAMVSKQDTTP